uniref:Uncharacterized protein n=1 Tax=Kalanchoe fedtschenkoi TaxID=63787 RepID=A0A7N0UTK4_KALFE
MGCGVSTFFYAHDDVGLMKPVPPDQGRAHEDKGYPDNLKIVGEDVVSRQTMTSHEMGDISSFGSSSSSSCPSKVVCITMQVCKEIMEIEKPRENCLGDESKINSKETLGDKTIKPREEEHKAMNNKLDHMDSDEEDEPWWRKDTTEFIRSPSFRDYCIIHYGSDGEDMDEDEGKKKKSNEMNLQGNGKENTKVLDSRRKKSRGNVGKKRSKEKKVMRKEGSGSLRNLLNVAACYNHTRSFKSPPKSPITIKRMQS